MSSGAIPSVLQIVCDATGLRFANGKVVNLIRFSPIKLDVALVVTENSHKPVRSTLAVVSVQNHRFVDRGGRSEPSQKDPDLRTLADS